MRRALIGPLILLLLLAPGEPALAAPSGNWYPNEYYLHGHTDINFPVYSGSSCHRGTSYSLTSDEYVWIGVYAEVMDYCAGGSWGSYDSDGWRWNYDWPNYYHRARTSDMPSRDCPGHAYTANGGHNIHTDSGAAWPVDFTGWTDNH
jgi:hypothetical protein